MPDGRVLCFGGPLNEQVVRVSPTWGNCFEVPIPERVSYSLAEMTEPMAPAIRTARYDIERVGVIIDDEPMVWGVAFVKGFPRQRVIDAANVVLTLCRVPAVAWFHVESRRAAALDTGHALGGDCDICDGRGFDYIGRRCRRWNGS